MEVQHKKKMFVIEVASNKGKPIVTNKGFVNILRGGQFMGCDTITEEVFEYCFSLEVK